MAGSARYRNADQNDLLAKIANLSERLSKLERTPQLVSSGIDSGGISITEGSLRILDASGNVIIELGKSTVDSRYGMRVNASNGTLQMRIGQLQVGGYGMEVYDPATNVFTVSPTVATATVNAVENTTSSTYTDLTTPGPAVTVNIRNSGRALCLLTSTLNESDRHDAHMAAELAGVNNSAPDDLTSLWMGASGASVTAVIAGVTRVVEYTGLNAGSTTFTAKYRASSGGTAFFTYRNITVITL